MLIIEHVVLLLRSTGHVDNTLIAKTTKLERSDLKVFLVIEVPEN